MNQNPCLQASLFPQSIPPSQWNSCHDHSEYVWLTDPSLSNLHQADVTKLSKTFGFCPHLRCQLDNVTFPDATDICPNGLCFTTIAEGHLTAGACCFRNHSFESTSLLGYSLKTQGLKPKPLYKHSRIVLGDAIGASTPDYGSFINANLVHPGIIATQCPMRLFHPVTNIADGVKRMILEHNISTCTHNI